eukprot:TRINITY_DN5114_c0_g1_i1.p1 TRINITY_DN5114_c0_g1~~TRINITY_DN5114_c0_g1_i1.p1  ORF type:complete len:798 (-),score=302.22 TRINITY_DN5114_c0_g1_i1:161-2554(-)
MDELNGNGKRGLPKLREILRRQKQDSEDEESPDIEFLYDDADTHAAEIAEAYSYTEQPEFTMNQVAFTDLMNRFGLGNQWLKMGQGEKERAVLLLLDQVELWEREDRLRGARAILYLAQGCFEECMSDTECWDVARENVELLYKHGVFNSFIDLLSIETENTEAANNALRKLAVSLADSVELRTILTVLYIMVEVLRTHDDLLLRESFTQELGNLVAEDLLAIRLLNMVTRYCSGSAPHFPMKKVLLLLWKVILASLGGSDTLFTLKAGYREKSGIPPQAEDTVTVSKTMRAASPPASAAELIEATGVRRNRRGLGRMAKQSSLDEMGLDLDDEPEEFNDEDSGVESGFGRDSPRPDTPPPTKEHIVRGLPWTPKVRQKDIENFLDNSRVKFVGFKLSDDTSSLAGLPPAIHEGARVLSQHVYQSLAETQIKREEEIASNPLSRPEVEVEQTPAEILYQAMLPSLPQYMIALLKILLAAAPTSKAKTDSINIMTDVLPEEMPMTVMQSMKLGIDVNRHKEIIVKAVSAILLLLLKHFKINHVYQFEFMSQHLVFANCIPLVLKFFNQNIMAYIGSKNNIALLDFPSCVIGEQPELTAETLEVGDTSVYCWRNMASCVNLLRVLNKLTKWKHSRIMMLVVFKSAPILKRTLKVKHAMLQLYVLKLLKMQTKYLGRQWRKSNMKTMSAIYTKVRHRLNDDWAFGNDVDSRPWDFQAEECALRSAVDRFNNRRYDRGVGGHDRKDVLDGEFEPVDNCVNSVLGQEVELTEEFKANYEKWLQREVYNTQIDWDQLLVSSYD